MKITQRLLFVSLLVAAILAIFVLPSARAQTTNIIVGDSSFLLTNNLALPSEVIPAGPLSTLQSYLVNNDMTYTGWDSNYFTLSEGAVFSSVGGTPGASSLGNDMGLEVPLHSFSTNAWLRNLSIDSQTRFETVFGDIHSQQLGVAFNYNYGQVQLSAGLAGRYGFTKGDGLHAVPFVELKKATSVAGTSPFVRYAFPITSKPGAGEIDLGICFTFGKKF